jgi:glutamate N-acetyltransferase / amino-acid N-acetyltransferase
MDGGKGMADWQKITGGITAPKGFQAVGITAGLKPSGLPDLALIVSEVDAIAAGVFTTSHVRAACVDYCRDRLSAKPYARAILCNAGQANAGTGLPGIQDAAESATLVANALKIAPESILLASTGVIGQRIKMEALRSGIAQIAEKIGVSGAETTAQAITTTDLVTKEIALETKFGDRPVRIGGIAKGSGMIHPNMATMLAFITCDAAVSPHLWQEMLQRAADQSFNQITVDGDTSTNDSLIALSNGQSRTPVITTLGAEAEKLAAMLTEVCQYLAKSIARDGEGATCLVEVQVSGAPNDAAARQIARTIAASSLTKSAIFGRDPNWGRIAGAAGRAGIPFDQNDLEISLGEFILMQQGQPLNFDRAAANAYLVQQAQLSSLDVAHLGTDRPHYNLPVPGRESIPAQSIDHPVMIAVKVGSGAGKGTAWGCDLSYDYVKINAEYTT